MVTKNKILIFLSTIVSLAISVFIYGVITLGIIYGKTYNDSYLMYVGEVLLLVMVLQVIVCLRAILLQLKHTDIQPLRAILYGINGWIGYRFFLGE